MFIKFSMPCHVEGQRAAHADVSLYVVHAIEDDICSRNIKYKTSLYASIAIHDSQRGGKYLYTVRGLGLHPSALDAEFAFFSDDILLPKIADIGDSQA